MNYLRFMEIESACCLSNPSLIISKCNTNLTLFLDGEYSQMASELTRK